MLDVHHSDFIHHLAAVYKPKVYVELGLYEGETFDKVSQVAGQAIGVDIVDRNIKGEVHIMTTEKYFKEVHKGQIDMAFIDADHTAESVLADIAMVASYLAPGGIIILHDTDPEKDSLIDPGYCGDAWKVVERFENSSTFNIVTLPLAEAGLSILTKKNATRTHQRKNERLAS
jgi:hypothetical protein